MIKALSLTAIPMLLLACGVFGGDAESPGGETTRRLLETLRSVQSSPRPADDTRHHGYGSPAAGHCRRHRRGAARLREGRANTARGAAHFLRETVGRVRYGGARGQLTVRADSGFYTVVAACRDRFSITIRGASLRDLIEARISRRTTRQGANGVARTARPLRGKRSGRATGIARASRRAGAHGWPGREG